MKGYNHGKLISEETRKKMSEASKKSLNGFKKGHKNFIEKHSEETKKKMSEYAKKIGRKPKQPEGYKHSKETLKKLVDSHTGEKNVNWKGGITPKNKLIRSSAQYKQWREDILKHNSFICQNCGQLGGDLIAHHINNFAENEDKRFLLSNGITLCINCHKDFHFTYSYRNNTLEQLVEFLGE
jgi:5-methylcytosine-specific restriction endonuclease McrA